MERANQDEAAKILISTFKDFVRGKTIDCRCPSNGVQFFKYLVDRNLIEVHCKKCSEKWSKLKTPGKRKANTFIFHRYDVKMNLVETVIVDGKEEKVIERK